MRIGELRHFITIERAPTPSPNTFGERVPVPVEWKKVWGKIEPISGRESTIAKSYAASVSHKITIRYLDGVKPTDRVNYGGRIFGIDAAIDPDELKERHFLYCTETVAG
jgi:SPP1 family predicted phage head-tail adaptor